MSVNDIMTKRVVSVKQTDSLHTISALFEATGFHHLLVLDGAVLTGIISDRDLLKIMSPFIGTSMERAIDAAIMERQALQIMTKSIVVVRSGATITSAISLFNKHKISCLPVINRNKEPVGIISWRDVMRYMEDKIAALRER